MSSRTVSEVRRIGDLLIDVCNEVEFQTDRVVKLEVKAAYYKAMYEGKEQLAEVLKESIDRMNDGKDDWYSIDDLYALGKLTIMDEAFCKDL